MANYINDFFTHIGPNLAKKCDRDWNYEGHTCDHALSDITTSQEEVIKICKKIIINKSSCVKDLSGEILRDAFLAIPEKLCMLFNNCFNIGAIPKIWKYAKVTSLPKGGDSQRFRIIDQSLFYPYCLSLLKKLCIINYITNSCNGSY